MNTPADQGIAAAKHDNRMGTLKAYREARQLVVKLEARLHTCYMTDFVRVQQELFKAQKAAEVAKANLPSVRITSSGTKLYLHFDSKGHAQYVSVPE